MPLIEGIGDEVTFVFAALLVLIVVVCAWLSTHTRDIPFFRLLIVDLTRRRNRSAEPAVNEDSQRTDVPTQGESEDHTSVTPQGDGGENAEHQGSENRNTQIGQGNSPSEERNSNETDSQEGGSGSSETETVSQCDTHIQSDIPIDSETVRQRRLAFLSKQKDCTTDEQSGENGIADIGNLPTNSSNVSSVSEKQNVGASVDSPQTPVNSEPSIEPSVLEELNDGNIRVKLKYLNDTQRLVQTNPLETIGQFKRTHFGPELDSHKLVRLIFNGQCLQNDTSTLQSYNIQDNCTVHCLVTEAQQQSSTPQSDTGTDMDISIFMFPLFAFFLATVWYFRLAYRQYFNAMATFSLVGITFLFSVALFSTWRARHGREEHQHLE